MRHIAAAAIGVLASGMLVFAQTPAPVPPPRATPAPAPASPPAEPELFVPSLALIKEKEGKFILVAVTYMPNSCYRAILTRAGFPAKEKVTDAEGVQLIVKNESGKLCAKMRWPIFHQHGGLKPGKGMETVWVYTVVDGKVEGKNQISLSSARDISALTGGEIPTPF
jgi:hypothetical protein